MTRLRVLAHFTPNAVATNIVAEQQNWLDIHWVAEDDDDALHAELPQADVLWHVLRPLSAGDLKRGTRLKLVHKLGAGVNTIDVTAATALGIKVANMPGANAASVAETTVLLMLATLRRLLELDGTTRAGRGWPTDSTLGDRVRDLGGCTVGLIGYGNIAQRVERILTSMGATVLHTSTAPKPESAANWRPLPDLLAASDILSLHLPLTAETQNLLNATTLAQLKPGAILVNTARGGIVEESALIAALRSGQLAGAGLDVFATEPVAPDNPLLMLDNTVLMPHVSWYTADTMTRYLELAVHNCHLLRDGLPLQSVVN